MNFQGISHYQFVCDFLDINDDITLTTGVLHMHGTGAAMRTAHYRNGKLLDTSEIEYVDS